MSCSDKLRACADLLFAQHLHQLAQRMHDTLTGRREALRRVVPMRHEDAVRTDSLSDFEVVQSVADHNDLFGLPRELLDPVLPAGHFALCVNIIRADQAGEMFADTIMNDTRIERLLFGR